MLPSLRLAITVRGMNIQLGTQSDMQEGMGKGSIRNVKGGAGGGPKQFPSLAKG